MDSTPSKRRKLSPTTSTSVYNADQTTPSRASFMSPTKASLSRFNPDLLSQPRSHIEEDTLQPSLKSPGRGMSLTPRRRSHAPQRTSSTAITLEKGPKKSSTISASPPEAAKEVEQRAQEIVDEQLDYELQANTPQKPVTDDKHKNLRRDVVDSQQDGELELPPTPTQLGLEPAPEPPKGLLFSSPSRRAVRRKGANLKTSPLKPRNLAPDNVRGDSSQLPLPSVELEVEDSQLEPEAITVDEETSRKQETRQRLLEQLKNIQDDVTRMEAELDRVRDPSCSEVISQEERDELISILTSENPTHRPLTPPPKPISISTRLSQFLPFSRTKPPPPPKFSIPKEPPPSHHPIELDDPLPHLRRFTPLIVSSEDTFIPSSVPNKPLLQQRDITLSSPHNLLLVNLKLITNPTDQTVDSLTLTSISPWADRELGSWIRKELPSGDISSISFATSRYWDLASIRSRCWQSCEDEFGHLLDSQTSSKSTPKPPTKKSATPKGKGRRRRKPSYSPPPPPALNPTPLTTPPASASASASDSDSDSDSDSENELTSPIFFSRSSLHKYLSQPTLLFTTFSHGSDVSLLITWRIGFDWTGEVESHLSAATSFPAAWEGIDERGSLEKVPEAFSMLVQEMGVRSAVGGVVGLLFGE